MISELSARANPSNNKARYAFYILLGLAAALTAVYMAVPLYKGIIGLAVIGVIVAAVLIYTKYIGSVYFYDITFDHLGEPLLVVRQITGRRQSTLARVSLAEIISVSKESAEERRMHKTPAGYLKYSYLPTLMPVTSYRITSSGRYERSEILVEISDEFASLLENYAAEARALANESED